MPSEDLKRFRGQYVRVFPDVIHPGLVYVYVSNAVGWLDAKSIFTDFFALYSKRELLGVIAELKHGRLHGVRDPTLIATVLAEKLLELERDPARKDHLAQQMDRLMNRAPSLLKTEPDSHNYFNAPPNVGAGAMVGEISGTTAKECEEQPGNAQPVPGAEAAAAAQAASQVDADAPGSDAESVNAATGSSDADPPHLSTKDEDFEVIVRPSRLSF